MNMLLKAGVAGLALVMASGFAADAKTPKDTLVMAWVFDDIISLDPAEIYEFSSSEYMANAYDRLVVQDLDKPGELKMQARKAIPSPTTARSSPSRSVRASNSPPATR